MEEPNYSDDSKTLLSLTEEVTSLKRPRSPLSSKSSETTLLSRLHSPKRKQLSTPISLKYSPSGIQPMSPDPPDREFSISVSPTTRAKIYPHMVTGAFPSLMGPTTKTKVKLVQKGGNSLNQMSHGTRVVPLLPLTLSTPAAKKPVGYSEYTTETSPKPSFSSKSLTTHHPEFHHHSGNESSKETQLTSIKSSPPSTILSLMRKERVAWETRKSLLESLNQKSESRPPQNGLPPGEELLRQSVSLSPIAERNSSNMVTTWNRNSRLKSSHPITSSFCTTLPYATKSQPDNTFSSLISTDSLSYIQPSSFQMESNPQPTESPGKSQVNRISSPTKPISVINSTPEPARTTALNANTATSAGSVANLDTARKTVRTEANEIYGLQPKYLRHNLWDQGALLSPTTAEWSETARPLPRPPYSEIFNPISSQTIADNPDLFQVHTPIKVDLFESLLKDHPNPLFVKSVCEGLREGFWPWADTLRDDYPITHDESRPMPSNEAHASFIREQCIKERDKGYFSSSFGPDLLPGMYSMPIHAVPKPRSSDLRMITDHSAGRFSLNSMIDHSQVTGFPLDNMRHLGEMLFDIRRSSGNAPLTLWKSDIADAYRLLPMSPHWQIKQIITVDGQRYVDRNVAFGSSSCYKLFLSLISDTT
jgi:hypothetical protein